MTKVHSKVIKKSVKQKTDNKTVPQKRALAAKPAKKTTLQDSKNKVKKATVTKKRVPTSKKSTTKTQQKKSSSVVVLPTRMSIRAREKVMAYAEAIEKRVHRPAYALTMTLGVLFVLFGSFASLPNAPTLSICGGSCSAQLLASQDKWVFKTNADQSAVVTQEVGRTIRSQNAYSETATFRSRTNNYSQSPSNSGENTTGDSDDRSKSTSTVLDTAKALVPEFAQDILQPLNETEETETIDDTTNVQKDSPAESEDEVTETENPVVDTISINGKSKLSGIATFTVQSSASKFISIYLRRVQSTERQLAGKFNSSDNQFTFDTRDFPNGSYELFTEASSVTDTTVSNSVSVTVTNVIDKIIEIEPAPEPVPNEGREILKITKELISPTPTPTPTPTPVTAEQKPTPQVPTSAGQAEVFAPADSTPVDIEQSSGPTDIDAPEDENEDLNDEELLLNSDPQEPVKRRALEKLEADTETLDALFTRYAVAVQSGDVDLIRESRKSLTTYKRTLVEVALSDETDRFIADDLAVSLEEEIERIVVKVETFESLRREKMDGSASTDTDGDGITDTDERVLFKTDPLKADTDGDGFTDGVEIIKGFNPNDAASEAVIVFRSPKETVGIVANETLQVVEVIPDVQPSDIEQEATIVQAKVRGKGLPNSFVTLFIFSTPTVVTVRTEADGSFEYTFSKELEDGEHQVFVALTDNTGDIVAQSEPFTFIKQAEAFSVVDAQAVVSDIQAAEMLGTPASPYRTVLSMSVLALGILLILLGVGLRSNKPEEADIVAGA